MVKTSHPPPRTGLRRLIYVYGWRTRYWWHDTPEGAMAQKLYLGALILILTYEIVRMAIAAALPPPPREGPDKAIYWWIIQLIIVIVAAALSYLLAKPAEAPEVQKADIPTTEEGKAVVRIYGTVRIKESQVLAWASAGTKAIKKGGKK